MGLFDWLGDGTDKQARERFNRERAKYEKRENEREKYIAARQEDLRKTTSEDQYQWIKKTYDEIFAEEFDEFDEAEMISNNNASANKKEMYVALKPAKGKEVVLSWRLMGGPGSATYTYYTEKNELFQDLTDHLNRYMSKTEWILRHSELVVRRTVTDCEKEEIVKVEERVIRKIPTWEKIIYLAGRIIKHGESFDSMSQIDINEKVSLKADNKIRPGDRVYWIDEDRWCDDTSEQPGVKRVTEW